MKTGKPWFVDALTGVEGGCIAAILCLGGVLLHVEPPVCGQETVAPETRPPTSEPAFASVAIPEIATETPLVLQRPLDSSARAPSTPAAGALAPAEDIDDCGATERESVRKDAGEAQCYARFLASHARGPGELEREARRALAEPGALYAKVAALRALRDSASPEAGAILADAIRTLPDVSDRRSISVPRFALNLLVKDAPQAESARRVLQALAWGNEPAPSSELRRIAALGLASTAPPAELADLAGHFRAERDHDVFEITALGLSRNPNAAAAEAILWGAGLDPESLRRRTAAEE